MKTTALLILMLFYCGNTIAQINYLEGKEFWFGFMQNMPTPSSDIAITSNNGANGLVEIPASGWSQAFTVGQNGSIELTLPLSLTQGGNTGTFPYGVKITADDTISVYAINRTSGSDDATMIKPTKALGFKHYVSTWQEPAPLDDLSEYIIVSTSDQTLVEITTPLGSVSTISLDEGEIYQYQAGTDLTGTLIESVCNQYGTSNPIAVFSGARATRVGTNGHRDHIVSQMYPVDGWGTSFNLIPLPYADNYFIKVIASENGTTVNVNGANYVLGQGDFFELNQVGFGYVSSNKPISVQLFTRGADYLAGTNLDGDPLMINVSPDNLGVVDTRFYSFDVTTSFIYPQYVQIVTPTANTGSISLDGVAVGGWNVNPFNPQFSSVEITLPQGATDHTITSTNESFIAYPSAQLHARSYGYCIGHNTPFYEADFEIGYLNDTLIQTQFTDTICSCEPVWFNALYPDTSATFSWEFENGTFDSGDTVSHTFPNGSFEVTLSILDQSGCARDSVIKYNLTVVNCDIEMSSLDTICQGDSVTLSSVYGTQFLWSTGDSTSSIVVAPNQTTTYSLQVDGGLMNICEAITIYVYDSPLSLLDDSTVICSNDEVTLAPGISGNYFWSTGETTEQITISEAGVYSVEIIDSNQCSITDTIVLFVYEAPLWNLESDSNELCDGDDMELMAVGMFSGNEEYEWSTSETSNAITVYDEGTYWLAITDSICYTMDSISIQIVFPWELTQEDSILVCAENVVLSAAFENTNYLWSTGDTTSQIVVNESGSYAVETMNACGSSGATFEVEFDCSFAFYLPNSFTPNDDQINDVFKGEGVGIDKYLLRIFNRWGEIIFESDDLDFGWNGLNSKGQEIQSGTYTFKVEITDVVNEPHTYTGHVNLIR